MKGLGFTGPFEIAGFPRLFTAALVSGLGGSLVPIAFALESHRLEPSGWGLTVVLLSLWSGRFIGVFAVQRIRPARNPVRVMILSDLVRFIAQAGLLGWILTLGTDSPPTGAITALSISSGVYGIALAFFQPARFTVIPRLIPLEQRGRVNAWLSVLGDVFAISGPLLGSLVFLSLGFQAILLIDSIGFLVGIVVLAGLRLSRSPSQTTPEASASNGNKRIRAKLPPGINTGLATWLFVALTIGLLGTAGPTLVIEQNSAATWAVTAAFMAAGSLVGSASSLLGFLKRVPWKYLHLLCCLSIATQLLCFLLVPLPVLLWAVGFLGAALTTASGIQWDTLGQSIGDDDQVHTFAVRDQIVNTVGVPAGMLFFGVAGAADATFLISAGVAGAVALMGVVITFAPQPTAETPRPLPTPVS
ncbi:major facilitator superfamily MFS_1 [Pseudarthrobacter chlorophenolicus A6]|uniref:Major facilitator superfamily MFS_1 n=1 Tax=Pseudarthrobacter chlorophenolicus (strain ATCC 700700 / DSM 12829 / CIP 107037 / JCM 12360 / KCTC 9906 / NCIMB 13794 / A6) TaxID=452863 RepID=B8HA02_PSECP|nr:MFS transporter [Pseudarthrobacter chlorophenolicus]ACL38386.1 major facilitator superfamily MFS_1 [Pseudarthrobacter chlorophenolicus A6]SDQ49833.1 Major Facilitator Superfamily protein [Pseudarthrobacter chlorophenolicus]